MAGLAPTRVLLVEAADGLVLVDSGIGRADIADPARRLGALRHLVRPALDVDETAHHRIRALGLDPADVRHIVLTHLDFDHIGGLADFPDAAVHVTDTGLTWAVRIPRWLERRRYRRPQWAHRPRFIEYEFTDERWEGFRVARLDHVLDGMRLVDLPGHTPGHAGVLVPAPTAPRTGDDDGAGPGSGRIDDDHSSDDDEATPPTARAILHAGDAFYHRGQIDPSVRVPAWVGPQERVMALEGAAIDLTHARLAALSERRAHDLDVVCAHDPSGPGGLRS